MPPHKTEQTQVDAPQRGDQPPTLRSLVRGCFLCLAVVGGLVALVVQSLSPDFLERLPIWANVLIVVTVGSYCMMEIRWSLNSIYGDSDKSENSIRKTEEK